MSSQGGIRAGKAYMELYGDDSKLNRMLEGSKAKVQAWGTAMSAAGTQIMMAGAAMLAPLAIGLKTFMSAGDELDKMSSRVGASVEFLSALGHAAQIGGTTINAMEVGIRRMQRTAMDATRGLSTAVDTFNELGVSVAGADGELKSTEQLFTESAQSLAKIDNNTRKAALATMLFGRAGTSLLPMLKDGAAGLDAVMQKAHDLGIVMTTEEATAAAVMVDRWTELKGVLKMATVQIGAALAPAVESLTESLTETLSPMIAWIKVNQDSVVTYAKAAVSVLALGAALKVLGIAATVAAANPMVLCLAAAVAAGMYFSGALDEVTASMRAESQEAVKAAAAGDNLRASMINQMNQLKLLAEKEQLSNTEMERAKSIIATLTDQYGDLGLRIDETTGKITGMTKALKVQAAVHKEAAIAEQHAILAALALEMEQKREALKKKSLADVLGFGGIVSIPRAKMLEAEINVLAAKQAAALAKLRAIHSGAETVAGEGGVAGADDWEEREKLKYQWGQIRLGMIQDAHSQEMNKINAKYNYEEKKARKLAKTKEEIDKKLADINTTRRLELTAAEVKHDREVAKEKEKQAKSVADQEEQLHREVERLEIEKGMPEGRARDKALLELERDWAIAGAKKISPELAELTKQKYDLLGRDIKGERKEGFTVGTFSKFALEGLGMGGPMERAAKAAEASNEELKVIRRRVSAPGKMVAVFAK